MSDLMNYLLENVEATSETDTVIISERLKEHPFTIKPISSKLYNKYMTDCRVVKKKKITSDENKFSELMITACCIDPNFKDTAAIEGAGCKTPGELIDKLLTAGEIRNLTNAIATLSGFDEEIEDLVDEAKN